MKRMGWIFAVMIGLATAVDAQDQRETGSIIAERVEELQNLRSRRRQLIQAQVEQAASDARVIQSLESSLAAAEQELAVQARELERLTREKTQEQERIDKARRSIAVAAAATLPVAHAALERIRSGLPVDQPQRTRPFEEAIGKLSHEQAAPADASSAILAVLDRLGDEIALSKTVELTNTDILLDGGQRKESVWRLRLGLIHALFVAENGKAIGTWAISGPSPWKMDLDEDVQKQIEAVIDVARERQPPRLTPLPVPIRPAVEAAAPSDGSAPQ